MKNSYGTMFEFFGVDQKLKYPDSLDAEYMGGNEIHLGGIDWMPWLVPN